MALWRVFFVLGVVMAVRLTEEEGTKFTLEDAPGAPAELPRELKREEQKALQSPWLKVPTTLKGYTAEFQGLLSDKADNVTLSGMLSKVSFNKGGHHEFTVALKGEDYTPERYVPEVELTWAAAQGNGLSIGVIQGAHVPLEGSSKRRMYMMTEFLDSVDLHTVASAKVSIDAVMARMVLAQLFYSMWKLDSQGIYHRDIKLENFLLTPSTCKELFKGAEEAVARWRQLGCRIVLIDYGLACASKFNMVAQFKRDIGCRLKAVGSPLYLAPEVLTDRGSQRSDIFSLGVAIYTLFHGDYPHDAATDQLGQRRFQQKGDIWPFLRKVDMADLPIFSSFPDDMKPMLSRMLRRDLRCRPSATDLWNSPLLDSEGADEDHPRNVVVRLAEHAKNERDKTSFAMYADGTSAAPWEQEFEANQLKYKQALDDWQQETAAMLQCEGEQAGGSRAAKPAGQQTGEQAGGSRAAKPAGQQTALGCMAMCMEGLWKTSDKRKRDPKAAATQVQNKVALMTRSV